MTDPLNLLRKFIVKRKEIVEKNGEIVFGNISFNKNIKTDIYIHGSNKKHYYTLECLVYFIKNSLKNHIDYMRQATIDNMPAVQKEDRRSILKYLFGHTPKCDLIDKDATRKKIQQKSLTDVMSHEQIAAIRAKYHATKLKKQNRGYLRVKNMNGRF